MCGILITHCIAVTLTRLTYVYENYILTFAVIIGA